MSSGLRRILFNQAPCDNVDFRWWCDVTEHKTEPSDDADSAKKANKVSKRIKTSFRTLIRFIIVERWKLPRHPTCGFVWLVLSSINISASSPFQANETRAEFLMASESPSRNQFADIITPDVILIRLFFLPSIARYFIHSWQHYKHESEYFNFSFSLHSWKSFMNDKWRKKTFLCCFILSLVGVLRKLRSVFSDRRRRRWRVVLEGSTIRSTPCDINSTSQSNRKLADQVKFHLSLRICRADLMNETESWMNVVTVFCFGYEGELAGECKLAVSNASSSVNFLPA